MAQIVYLRLDSDYDPVFDPAVALQDIDAVTQAIKTRLALWQGEWWENLKEGTPMFQNTLGAPGSQKSQAAIALAFNQRILGTPYVSAVADQVVTYDRPTRKLTYTATAQTAFGPAAVSFSPGAQAGSGLGG